MPTSVPSVSASAAPNAAAKRRAGQAEEEERRRARGSWRRRGGAAPARVRLRDAERRLAPVAELRRERAGEKEDPEQRRTRPSRRPRGGRSRRCPPATAPERLTTPRAPIARATAALTPRATARAAETAADAARARRPVQAQLVDRRAPSEARRRRCRRGPSGPTRETRRGRRRSTGSRTESGPGARAATKRRRRIDATPATAQFARRPTHVFSRFQGSRGPPKVRPAIAAAGSPKAIMAQTAAASGRYLSREDEDKQQHHRRIGDDAGSWRRARVAVDPAADPRHDAEVEEEGRAARTRPRPASRASAA